MLAEDLRLRLARFQRGNTDNSVLVVLRSSELQVEREYEGHKEVSKRSAAKRAADGDLIKFRRLLSRGQESRFTCILTSAALESCNVSQFPKM